MSCYNRRYGIRKTYKETIASHFTHDYLRKAGKLTWIDEVLEATNEVETPTSYIRWGALCAISAVLRNKVWYDKHYYKLYPNLYVMLVGDSGLRKGFATGISKELVRLVGGTRIISGRNSFQGIISALANTATTQNGGPPITHSSAYINSGEFSTSLVRDPDALTVLTDLYDGHYNPEWKTTLKSGVETLKGVNITLMGAMNPTHFHDVISNKEITGGFVARMIIVREFKRARVNDLLDPPINKYDVEKLAEYLKNVDKLAGPFTLSSGAKKEFRDWYKDFNQEEIDDKTGTAKRVHDQIMKVAMNVAVARNPLLVIERTDMVEAMDLCLTATSEVGKITAGTGISIDSSKIHLFMQELLSSENYRAERTKLLRKHYGNFSALELDNVSETLEQSGAISRTREGKEVWYTVKEDVVDQFKAILKKTK